MLALLGESKNHASYKNNTNSTRSQPAHQPARETRVRKANSNQGQQAGATRKSRRGPAGAGAVQTVQARLVRDRGTHSQCARHPLCVPLLSQVASRAGSGARFQENAAGAVEPLAQSRGVTKRDGTFT